MGSALQELLDAQQRGALAQRGRELPVRVDGDRVRVTIQARAGQGSAAAAAVATAGGRIVGTLRDFVGAEVPVAALPGLLRHGSVLRIDPLAQTTPASVESEGVGLIDAGAWHSADPAVNGAGIKIGIIDNGFQGYRALLGGELPRAEWVQDRCSRRLPSGDIDNLENGLTHGTSVAEIVHDVAPSAALYLVVAIDAFQIDTAVTCLLNEGVHVINHSGVLGFEGPGDGTGFFNSVVDRAVAGGIFWSNAGGNNAQRHWGGAWSDPEDDRVLNFSGSDVFLPVTVPPNRRIDIQLRWSDQWGQACKDYDLYLRDRRDLDVLAVVASRQDLQNCTSGQNPLEDLSYTTPNDGQSRQYYIEVFRYGDGSSTDTFDIMTNYPLDSYRVAANSLKHPADNRSAGMVAVGAVGAASPTTLKDYSAQGPTTDGRIKPDLVAPTDVSTATDGTPPSSGFGGTSGATPHVAGAAALVKQANPTFTPADVKELLRGRAIDLGPSGPDNQFGHGRVHLGAAPVVLAGRWMADNDANDAVGAHHGAYVDGVDYAAGQVGQAFKLNGVNQWVQIPDAASLKPTTLTVAAWVNFADLNSPGAPFPGLQYLVFKKNTRSSNFDGYSLVKVREGGVERLRFTVVGASGTLARVDSTTTSVAINQWYHVVGTYDRTVARLYVNGALQAEVAATFPLDYAARPLFFGRTGEATWEARLQGRLDDVRLYNRALSAQEVAALANP